MARRNQAHAYTLDQYKELRNQPAVVIFFTATWCGPCRTMYGDFERLKSQYPEILFVKIDVDASPEVNDYCVIQAMPTFMFYLHGKKQKDLRFKGADIQQLMTNCCELASRLDG